MNFACRLFKNPPMQYDIADAYVYKSPETAKKPWHWFSVLLLLLFFFRFTSFAQITQLEHSSTSYSGNIPSGPSTSWVRAKFVNNTSGNTFVAFNPEITVTASFSDQQYNHCAGITNLKGNFFGGAVNDDDKSVTSQTVWRKLSSISNPPDKLFTSNPTGTVGEGISVNENYGFNMFTTVEPLYTGNKGRSDRYYYSKLTITFNRAISNPVLHIVGLGGTTSKENDVLGFATELELENGSGITLKKLSGSAALKVENNKILNGKSIINDQSSDGAATGSIRVTGNNITSLVFKIYLRGDGQGSSWSSKNIFCGDQWLMAFSMNAASISGSVFDDGNALSDAKVNAVPANDGVGTNINGTLRVNLMSEKTLVATADVAADGAYVFQDIVSSAHPATYKLVLTTDPASGSPKLPAGWVNTGENRGIDAGHDGDVNGILEVTLANETTSVKNANFGVNKIPVSYSGTSLPRPNPRGTNKVVVPELTGTDLEDSDYSGADKKSTIKINSLPASEQGTLYYANEKVTLNQVISNYDPDQLTVDPADGSPTVKFLFSHRDAAGSYSDPVEVNMPFYTTYFIGGNVFDDANGMVGNLVDGPGIKGSDIDNTVAGLQPVFISLVSGTVIYETVAVGETGSYSFTKSYPAGAYKVILHTSPGGSLVHALPLTTLWYNTGEHQGVDQGHDGAVDGELAFNITDADIAQLNFGINKIPAADSKAQAISAPSAATLIPLDGTKSAPALSGFDYEDNTLGGTGSKVVITKLPTHGTLYYADKEIILLNTVLSQNFNPSSLKIKLNGTEYHSTEFEYAFVDAAGKQGVAASYQLTWNTPLPVTLTTFTGTQQERTALLNWSTTHEANSDRFEIQRGNNGKDWVTLGSVAANGESPERQNYSFADSEPVAGQNLYRLKMVDLDGSLAYSRIISVYFKTDFKISVYPNPATDFIRISTEQNDPTGVAAVGIYNLAGSLISTNSQVSDTVDVKNLQSGNYIVKITKKNGTISMTKLTINR